MKTQHALLPNHIMDWLYSVTQDSALEQFTLVQPLWSNFGKLVRCFSPAHQTPFIVKWICQPADFKHPRGWNSQVSQQRKWHSYAIEREFYQKYAKPKHCALPRLIAQQQLTDSQCLVLSDLDFEGYPARPDQLTPQQCEPVLRWLAAFHAEYINTAPDELWERGSYWHLGTRQDEWQNMESGPLKSSASKLDNALRNCPYQTFIHGDAKLANFCFSEDLHHVAAVDFQYVGGGTGVQDVTYFLGSALTESQLLTQTESLLDSYFETLAERLVKRFDTQFAANVCRHWRDLYDIASADFHRFLSGWSPSHAKINRALHHHTRIALNKL